MIKKYNDFLDNKIDESFDNELYSILLESNVVFSTNFKRILTKIEDPVSDAILSIENQDLPVTANYFDIDTQRNDYLFFTPDRKAQEILNDTKEYVKFTGNNGGWLKHSEANQSIFDKLGYVPGAQVYVPVSIEVGEIISELTSSSGKTWCFVKFEEGEGVFNKEKLRAVDDKEKRVWKSNRQDMKVGRSMNALLKLAQKKNPEISFVAKDIEKFVNLYKMQVDKLNDKFSLFEVVQGEDIAFWYNNENYHSRSGQLGSSCMSNVEDNYFEPYVTSDNVSLVIYKSEDDRETIVGRAIVWKLNDGKTFMDRIYTNVDSDVELFRQFAKENGWYYKKYNNSSVEGYLISPDGTEINITLIVQISGKCSNFPYLDTLKFYSPTTGLISNDPKSVGSTGNTVYHLESTEGDFYYLCEVCDGECRVDCEECNGTGRCSCNECDGKGTVTNDEGEEEECDSCSGDGVYPCDECDGGKVDCPECG